MAANGNRYTRKYLREKLFSPVAEDVRLANWHFKLYVALMKQASRKRGNHLREYNQSPLFWNLTMDAHLRAAYAALARAYDRDVSKAISLRSLLDRLYNAKGTSVWRPKLPGHQRPSDEEFARDKRLISYWGANKAVTTHITCPSCKAKFPRIKPATSGRRNPLVRKLMWARHKLYSHRDLSAVKVGGPHTKNLLTVAEFQQLVQRGLNMLDKYGRIYLGTTLSPNMNGEDDYIKVLDAIRLRFHKSRTQEALDMREFATERRRSRPRTGK